MNFANRFAIRDEAAPNPELGGNAKLSSESIARAALGEPAKKSGAELLWRCPRHADEHPSLQINAKKNVFLCAPCNASGTAWALAAFIAGVDANDKPAVTAWLREKGQLPKRSSKAKDGRGPAVAEFIHADADGSPVYKKVRHEPGADGRPKDYLEWHCEAGAWKPGRGGVIPPLYRLPEIKNEPLVFLFESHTDVECAVKMNLPATTSGGADSWRPEYAQVLAQKDVCVIPDSDTAGARFAATACNSLHQKAASIKVISIAPYPDFRRWADAGGTLDKIFDLYEAAEEWRPASGAELLRRFESGFESHIVSPRGTSLVGGLYVMLTHCFELFSWIPYLCFSSPRESCGKSHAADIVGWASARPEIVVSITQAALFRLITESKPTVIVDEAEVLCGEDETAIGLRAILHAGNAPDDAILRCAPNTHALERFSPFCPKVFCAIGGLTRVLSSRCVEIAMQRRRSGEHVRAFVRRRVKAEMMKLGAEMAAWVEGHADEILKVYESLPDDFFEDRAGENFAPLAAILQVADPARLPELAEAHRRLAGDPAAAESDPAILRDIARMFAELAPVTEASTAEMLAALNGFDSSPWAEFRHGKPLTACGLAKLLKPFGIMPDRIGGKGSQARGYTLSQFKEVFERYLTPPIQPVNPSTDQCLRGSDGVFQPVHKNSVDTLKNTVSANVYAGCGQVDTLKAGPDGHENAKNGGSDAESATSAKNDKKLEGALW